MLDYKGFVTAKLKEDYMMLDRYIRIKELATMLGIGRSTTYRLISENKFRKQIKITEISF